MRNRPLQAHVQHKVPLLLGQDGDGLADGDAGVVVQDVDAAELVHDGLDRSDDVLLVGDVTLEEGGLTAGVPHLLGGLLGLVAHVNDGHGGAVGGQQLCHAQANAGAASRDNSHLTSQVQRIFLLQHDHFLLIDDKNISLAGITDRGRSGRGRGFGMANNSSNLCASFSKKSF